MKDSHHDAIYEVERTHWWYRVRRKMIHDLLRAHRPHAAALRILDVGCGTGALLSELKPYGRVEGVDISPKALAYCKSRGFSDVQEGSASATGHASDSFDIVLALDILEHVPDDKSALAELYRVLKPGGKAILFVPTFMFLWGANDVLSEHYRRYTRSELAEKARAVGFCIERSSYFNTFLFPLIALVRIATRLFRIPIKSEVHLGTPLTNAMFYRIFLLESSLLQCVRYPFGVSALVVCEKV